MSNVALPSGLSLSQGVPGIPLKMINITNDDCRGPGTEER
jgi:hypothetical protein